MLNSNVNTPTLTVQAGLPRTVIVTGNWRVLEIARPKTMKRIRAQLQKISNDVATKWDLSNLIALDHIGAQLFWNAWNKTRPAELQLTAQHEEIFARIENTGVLALPRRSLFSDSLPTVLKYTLFKIAGYFYGLLLLIGQLVLDLRRFIAHPFHGPWKEISANIYHIGFQALGVTALVGFLIGVVLSFLSSQQLRMFGGDIYLVNILGMSVVRELGPLLAAILVAGRSGSSITAQIGVMRVTEELDAMRVMGLPHGFRLIFPKVIALVISMPLLVIWTDAVALLGGMLAAKVELNLSFFYFLRSLPEAVPIANYWIGLLKGSIFGFLIALFSCYFGLAIRPNTESLGHNTTKAVVTAITVVILADAVFAVLFKKVGF